MLLISSFLLAVVVQRSSAGYYLPGVAPVDYPQNTQVVMKVNKLTSVRTQLPYEFYSLPFCKPEKVMAQVENLGEVLRGDRIENSMYELYMKVDEKCKVLCTKTIDTQGLKHFAGRIYDEYRVNFLLDNLPGAMTHFVQDEHGKPFKSYEMGFPVGTRLSKTSKPKDQKDYSFYLNNHVSITVLYHNNDDTQQTARVVGFEIEPMSIQHPNAGHRDCSKDEPLLLPETGPFSVTFTYDVTWKESEDVTWATRWDLYLYMSDDKIHWFGIFNSAIIVLFLTGLIGYITIRALRQDLSRYNALADAEDIQEEFGWKLVHGDVFRPPVYPMMLAVSVGCGVQIFGMCLVTLIFAVMGFLSPANRGALLSAVVVMFVLMGVWAGYAASVLYKMMAGTAWKRLTTMTAMFYPGIIFLIFFVVNFFIWEKKSSGAVPFSTLVALLAMWFCISLPLVVLGAYFGFKQKAMELPVRTNQIPRQIPEQVWYLLPATTILIGGTIPFGAIFIELFFILSSIWLHSFYYIFGILFLVFLILILTCGEIAIVMCYFALSAEDYRWWWRSFLTPASSALYIFLYSCFYYYTRLEIQEFVPTLLYFSYTTIFTLIIFLLTGMVGFVSCLFFVIKIYSSIKVD